MSEHNILAKTRAEEHDADVWGEFYIPPYYNRLLLKAATKSTFIVGKRGCGKTMLLKYLDYHTAFSGRRQGIAADEIYHVGIYWRVDTQFCNSLHHRGITEADWISIFESYFALVIGIEILKALSAIAKSSYPNFNLTDLGNVRLDSVVDFEPDYPPEADKLQCFLESKRRRFTSWISNIRTTEPPILPPGKSFIDTLIDDIKKVHGLENSSFYIYVDEVENLVPYQQRVLNSFLKHSQRPLIVSFTSKDFSSEMGTTGPESINATHDFKLLPLDDLWDDNERKLFFAEVFLANLDLAENRCDSRLLADLRNPDNLSIRAKASHSEKVLADIRGRFPGKTLKELASEAIRVERIRNLLSERIHKALGNHKTKISANQFMEFESVPDALSLVPALLNRPNNSPEVIFNYLEKYADGKSSPFSDGTDWIHNNLMGALLELYRPYNSLCPIYSGFDTFLTMANDNLRQFLILCYKSLEVAELSNDSVTKISIETQARAAYETAEQLIREIKTFGAQGERLRMFVLRLGNIFRALQSVPSMSEPEQNQFTINSGGRALDAEEMAFLADAKKYGVITEQLETKTKGRVGSDILDYQLNPIYSPYFQISYRRKRKIELSVEDFHILALGTEDAYKQLASSFFRHQDLSTKQAVLW